MTGLRRTPMRSISATITSPGLRYSEAASSLNPATPDTVPSDALVGHFLEHTDPVHKISVVSRGQALGLTVSLPAEDRFLTSRSALMDQLAMILGGRAAEELVFQEITTGAANDLERATAMARQMLTRFGMSEKLGPRVFAAD